MGLSTIKLKAIKLASTGTVWTDVAKQCGKSEKTITNWKQDPEFKQELYRQRQEYLQSCMDTARADIQALAPAAVECLMKAMQKGSVRAALAIAAGTGALKPPVQVSEEKITVEFGDVDIPK